MGRVADIKRKTNETEIELFLDLDSMEGTRVDNQSAIIDTGIGFLDHMLTLLGKHGNFGLSVKVSGDIQLKAYKGE